MTSETEASVQELLAETHLKIATDEGIAQTTLAAAEERSNAHLLKARQIELTDKQLAVYEALASNDKILVSDSKDKGSFARPASCVCATSSPPCRRCTSFDVPSIVASGCNASSDFNMMLLADNVLTSNGDGAHATHEGMLANLTMLRLASNAYGLRGDTYIPPGNMAGLAALD